MEIVNQQNMFIQGHYNHEDKINNRRGNSVITRLFLDLVPPEVMS